MIRSDEEGRFEESTYQKSRDFRISNPRIINYKEEACFSRKIKPSLYQTTIFQKSFWRQFLEFLSVQYINLFVFLSSFYHKNSRIFRISLVFLIIKTPTLLQFPEFLVWSFLSIIFRVIQLCFIFISIALFQLWVSNLIIVELWTLTIWECFRKIYALAGKRFT